jgi:hypothetical protein
MNHLRKRPYLATLTVCSLGLLIFLFATNPYEVGVGLMVVPAVLLFLIVFSTAYIGINLFNLMRGNPGKRRATALMVAALATFIMILQSTGGISMADVILLALIIVVAAIYIDRF